MIGLGSLREDLRRRRNSRTAAALGSPPDSARPQLSIVVIVFDMPRQAMQTLFTLSRDYQRDIEDIPYEVVVVENHSHRTLREREIRQLGPQFRYFLRPEREFRPRRRSTSGSAAAEPTGSGS